MQVLRSTPEPCHRSVQRQQLPLVTVRACRKIFTSGQRLHPNCSKAARLQRERELTSERGREGGKETERRKDRKMEGGVGRDGKIG